jgi:hypothetical protein
MKALSIKQPWAWLIVNGYKDIENRDWRYPPSYRGRFLIHASKVPDFSTTDSEKMDGLKRMIGFLPEAKVFEFGGIIGEAAIVDVVRDSESPWFYGPLGFVLRDAKPLRFMPCRGQLGFFDVDYPEKPKGGVRQ